MIFSLCLFGEDNFYYKNMGKITLIKLTDGDILETHYYKTEQNQIIGIKDEIIIKLKNDFVLENLLAQYDVILLEEIIPRTYRIKVKNNLQTLQIANSLHLENGVEYAQPNFVKIVQLR